MQPQLGIKTISKRIIFLLILGYSNLAMGQSVIRGTIISSLDGYPLEGAAVSSYLLKTGVLSDYRGHYTLKLADEDTLIFSYLGFKEQKIPVHSGWNTYYTINISMEVLPISLPNVNFGVQKNTLHDSLQNRNEYQGLFNYKRPTLVSYSLPVISYDISSSTYVFGFQGPELNGGIGFSLNGFYSRFLSSDGDRYLHYKQIMERREKETYVHHYFNAPTVHSITGLTGEELLYFMKHFEPKFKTLAGKSDYDIDLLIKQSFLTYKSQKQSSLTMPDKMIIPR